jgi:hypothetical protein
MQGAWEDNEEGREDGEEYVTALVALAIICTSLRRKDKFKLCW